MNIIGPRRFFNRSTFARNWTIGPIVLIIMSIGRGAQAAQTGWWNDSTPIDSRFDPSHRFQSPLGGCQAFWIYESSITGHSYSNVSVNWEFRSDFNGGTWGWDCTAQDDFYHQMYNAGFIVYNVPCSTGSVWSDSLPVDPRNGHHSGCVIPEDRQHFTYCNSCSDGNPIYPAIGNKRQSQDLGIFIGGFALKMTYDSKERLPDVNGGQVSVVDPPASFGPLWASFLSRGLTLQPTGATHNSANSSVVAYRGNQAWETFAFDGSRYVSTTDSRNALNWMGSSWRLIDGANNRIETYDSGGKLNTLVSSNGRQITFSYSTQPIAGIAPVAGLLLNATDDTTRQVSFTYEASPQPAQSARIKSITAADGAVIGFSYTDAGYLSKITWPDLAALQMLYERAVQPWALTGIQDESSPSVRFATFGYDDVGRAQTTEHAAQTYRYSVSYGSPPEWNISETYDSATNILRRDHCMSAPTATVLTDPLGLQRNIGVTSVNCMTYETGRSYSAGDDHPAASASVVYDTAANVASEVDYDGNRACYAYDAARPLRTVALEGLPAGKACPADLVNYAVSAVDTQHPERKTSVQWHPVWSLKTRQAEPKKITTWVYNGQPDPIAGDTPNCAPSAPALPDGNVIAVVCRRYEQATTDETGGANFAATPVGNARVWTYTYNQWGEVLAATEPGQAANDGLNHTTTYQYYGDTTSDATFTSLAGHTMGDLQQVTNPLGQQLKFLAYDKAGRLLSSQDANGTTTTRTYWPRGWIHTVTVTPAAGAGSAQTTTYDYYPTGLLKTVTLADGSALNYTYDDAHRLTDVQDQVGNKVHYVLDNSGNRTGEQVSDASGALVRTIAREFDALNRLKTVTGAVQ